jgi:class 3 adenylate cyclase/tetratricopeptide (TPR) repeat protein
MAPPSVRAAQHHRSAPRESSTPAQYRLNSDVQTYQGRMPPPRQPFYDFGPYRIDSSRSRLLRHGAPIPLPPKTFDLLVVFVRNAHRVLSKAELMATLWPDTFVEDANLTQHVFTLRKTLGGQPSGQPYIETIPRHGYCFSADVREAPALETMGPPSDAEPGAPREPAVPVAVEGERKQATVLHCSVANAAAWAERLGPEEMLDLMRQISAAAEAEIERYEGLMRQREPDAFVALFGARVVHEDDARRAALAALGLQRRLAARTMPGAPEQEQPLVRIGIHTGPVVVSRRGREHGVEYSAIGETMRIADLLQQLAEPGTILVSDATGRRIGGYLELASTATHAAGVTAFRLIRAVPSAGAKPLAQSRRLASFVGRDREMGLLANRTAQVLAGSGQVVNIVAEPGMGKSRLLHELSQSVANTGAMAVLEGRCVSYGGPVPYLPLADLIRAHCGITDSDTPDVSRHGVERAVREGGLPADASAWLLRLIGGGEAAAFDALSPEAIKARTFEVLRTLFLHASTRRPLALLVEDLHWIDRTSEEFLTMLVDRLVAARVMLITTCRPGYRAPWMDRSYATQIALTPLSADESAEIVSSVDRERRLSSSASASILSKAEGNPFFLEELTRNVVEHGPEGGRIPDTVHGVIMARLDRLPESAKQLLQTASVVGRELSPRLLARLRPTADLDAELDELCRLEFLCERPGGDEPVFVFKHALTQDVAYDSLLARRRRDLHLQTARALEDLYSDRLSEITARLAYHYTRTDLVEDAVAWLIRAGDQAAGVYANAEAMLHLDLARRRIERLPEGPARDRRTIEVALRQAHSLYFLGRFRESVEVLLPHEARLVRLNDTSLAAGYAFWLAHMYSRLGDQRRARESATRAIDAATRAGDEQTLGKAHGVLALEGHWSGDTADGIAHGRKAVELLRAHREQQWWLGMAHFYLAMNHLVTGDFVEALGEASRADAVGLEIGDPRLQTYAGYTSAWVEVTRGNHAAAVDVARRSRDQAPDRVSRAYASMILGFALLEAGDCRLACEVLEPIVTELESFGFPQWQGFATAVLADAYRQQGHFAAARELADRALAMTSRAGYAYGIGFAQRVGARIARDGGFSDEAADGWTQARATFERIGAVFEASRTEREAAGVQEKSPLHE